MTTLTIVIILFALFSTYKIHQNCKKENIPFNPYETNIVYHFGFLIGVTTILSVIIILCIKHLP